MSDIKLAELEVGGLYRLVKPKDNVDPFFFNADLFSTTAPKHEFGGFEYIGVFNLSNPFVFMGKFRIDDELSEESSFVIMTTGTNSQIGWTRFYNNDTFEEVTST